MTTDDDAIDPLPATGDDKSAPVNGWFDDPYRVLDDLMAVVEALGPVWPEREVFKGTGKYLL